jgi:hypothetical protein
VKEFGNVSSGHERLSDHYSRNKKVVQFIVILVEGIFNAYAWSCDA